MSDIDVFPPLPELHRVVMVCVPGGWRPAIRREPMGNGYVLTHWEFVDVVLERLACRDAPHWRECKK